MLTIEQVRAARGLLGWSQSGLAKRAGCPCQHKAGRGRYGSTCLGGGANQTSADLNSAGVEFIDENGGGPGVRLRKRQQKKG